MKSTRARFGALIAIVALPVLLTGCSNDSKLTRFGFPSPATKEGPTILTLWQGSWIAAGLVGILTWGLMIWAIVVYRRRDGDPLPAQTRYNVPLEIAYTIIPWVMVLGLFYFTAKDQSELTKLSGTQTHTVNVQGWRWSWGFNYTEEGAYDVGTPAARPVLYLPVDEKVKFVLTSPDVIHSFWIPAFLMKMDVVPGRHNSFEITPNKLGTFVGKCAELCGADHSRMLFDVKVVNRSEYDAHIAELKARGQVGLLDTGRQKVAGATQ